MRSSYVILSFAVLLAALSGCKHVPTAQSNENEPVISVEERPTMFRVISKRSGTEVTPGIEIYADGRCIVRTFRGEEIEKRLRSADVRQVFEFFDRQGLFSISDDSIERAIDRELQPVRTELPDGNSSVSVRGRVVTVDGTHTRIAAHTSAQKVEISRYAMHSELEHYRTVTELRTVQRCIDRVYAVAGKLWR